MRILWSCSDVFVQQVLQLSDFFVVAVVTPVLGGQNDGLGLVLILVTQLPGLPAYLDLGCLKPSLPGTKLSAGSPAVQLMER